MFSDMFTAHIFKAIIPRLNASKWVKNINAALKSQSLHVCKSLSACILWRDGLNIALAEAWSS